MAKFEDLIEQVRDEGLTDVADELESFKASALRKKAEERDAAVAERDEYKKKFEDQVQGPMKEKAFRDFGVDFDALRPLEREALSNIKPPEGEITESWISSQVEKYQFPLAAGTGEGEGEQSGARQIAEAATRPGKAKPAQAVITPEDAGKWDDAEIDQFKKDHPEEYEGLKEGYSVTIS
jgi:hypothetical protein